jgi:ubiquinone/menaquinone biosynthesis C-methylase UbiE
VDMNTIRNKWSLKQKNKQASINMWNSMADSFGNFVLPDFREDSFLGLLARENMLKPEGLVLDVGCGTGKYIFGRRENKQW